MRMDFWRFMVAMWLPSIVVIGACLLVPQNGVQKATECEPWVRAAVMKTVNEERYRCEEESYKAYQRGYAQATMGTCAP